MEKKKISVFIVNIPVKVHEIIYCTSALCIHAMIFCGDGVRMGSGILDAVHLHIVEMQMC